MKKGAVFLTLGHYKFNRYWPENISENAEDIINNFNTCVKEFKNYDDTSDIKMIDYFCQNHLKIRMFNSSHYPTDIFMNEYSNKIIEYLDCDKNKDLMANRNFGANTFQQIDNKVKETLALLF